MKMREVIAHTPEGLAGFLKSGRPCILSFQGFTHFLRKTLMKTFRKNIATLVSLAFCAVPLQAGATDNTTVNISEGRSVCDLYAWVSFRSTEPVAVHAEPDHTSSTLGYLPAAGGEDYANVEFHVTGTSPGWLKIENAEDPQMDGIEGKPLPPRAVYQGVGWIRSNAAQIAVQSSLGYARPSADSPVILNLNSNWLTDAAQIKDIRSCAGRWLLIDYKTTRETGKDSPFVKLDSAQQKEGTAWFRGICSNQYTTCDMRSVDLPPVPANATP
ncbi:hypothetical protein NIBR502774_14275 (plasmid) [Rhizobium sp. NIBRBAC000502774]|nr:hypothetical protein NIBR502774_14275 [Rhizobium sp. NIBRBAC000502774]